MADAPITAVQVDTIVHCLQVLEWPPSEVQAWLQQGWGVPRVKQLSQAQATLVEQTLVGVLAEWAAADAAATAAAADFAALAPNAGPASPATAADVAAIEARLDRLGWRGMKVSGYFQQRWRRDTARQLTRAQAAAALADLDKRIASAERPRTGILAGPGRSTP